MDNKKKMFKKDDYVLVRSGKFKGWTGRVWEVEKDEDDGWYYYSVFPDKKGDTLASDAGLGVILNMTNSSLKRVNQILS